MDQRIVEYMRRQTMALEKSASNSSRIAIAWERIATAWEQVAELQISQLSLEPRHETRESLISDLTDMCWQTDKGEDN